jgi:N6-adenosine-specific RNA methylase IME4
MDSTALDLFGAPVVAAAPPPVEPWLVADGPDDSDWPNDVFAHLPLFGFDLIMADPPWHFATHSAKGQNKGPLAEYRTWTLRKIKALPVGQLASRDAVLFLWATSPLMFDTERPGRSPVGEVIEAWGFRYGALGGWAKRTRNEKLRWGTGYVARSVMEPFIIATTGQPQHNGASAANLINGLARDHSRKPDAAFQWCERYMPAARRIEICGRQSRKGWTVWGDEAVKFDEVAA